MEEKEIVLKRAKNAVISRDFSLALRIYSSLLKYDSENIEYLRSIGSIYEKTGDDQKALEYYARILKISNSDFNALNSIGGIYRRLKNYDKAIMVLEKALQTGQNNAEVNYNLGFTYKLTGEYAKAIDCFESVIDQNPNDVLAYNHLGAIYYQNGEYNKSIVTYKRGLQVDSNHPILQYNLAKSYEEIGDEANAITAYETALRGKPGWIDAVRDYSALLVKQHKTKQALETVKKAEEIHTEQNEFHLLKGKILFEQFNYNAAEAVLEKAVLGGKTDCENLLTLALVYEAQERYAEAAETILKAEETCPDEKIDEVQKSAIQILISAGDFEEAWNRLVILMDNQKSPLLLDLEGQFYIASGKAEKLYEIERQINEIKPNFYRYLTDWGLSFLKKQNLEEAKKYFKFHIEKNRKSLKSWLYLAMAEEKDGNRDEAISEYRNVLKIDGANFIAQERLKELSRGVPETSDFSLPEENAFFTRGITENQNAEKEDNSDNYELKGTAAGQPGNGSASDPEAGTAAGASDEVSAGVSQDAVNDGNTTASDPADNTDGSSDTDTLSQMEMPETNILEIETEEIKSENYDFDGETKSLSQELLEGEELSDFGYEMPIEEEEEEDEKKDEEGPNPEIKIEGSGNNEGSGNTDFGNSRNEDRASEPETKPEDNYKAREPEPETPKDKPESYSNINPDELREMTEKLEQAKESALQAMSAAEKAWDAAQKAADSASAVDNAGDYINQLTEDAAKKLQNVSEDLKSEIEKKKDNSEPEEEALPDNDAVISDDAVLPETENTDDMTVNTPETDFSEEGEVISEGELSDSSQAFLDDDDSETLNENELDGILSMCAPEASDSEDAEVPNEGDLQQENQTYEHILSEVTKLLPYIENILQNKEDAQKFRNEVSLFSQLKTMGDFLPEEERRTFMTSRIRITLDFLIARLSGKPGLLKTSDSLKKSGVLEGKKAEISGTESSYNGENAPDSIEENYAELQNLSNLELVKKVINDMKNLTCDLDDKELAEGLQKMAEETEDKLSKAEKK